MRPFVALFVMGDVSGIGDLTKEPIMSTSRLQLALNVADKVWVNAPDVPLGGWEFYTVLADDPAQDRGPSRQSACCSTVPSEDTNCCGTTERAR